MTDAEAQGRKLLSAVERILADNDTLLGQVRRFQDAARASHPDDTDKALEATCDLIVQRWSNFSAASGAATALPALLPGMGSLVTLTGGSLVDMGLVLKFEVEMALALSAAHGFDITLEKERQIAFLLASVSTWEAREGRSFVVDVAEAEGVAIWNYAPRELSKLLLTVLTRLALLQVSKSLVRAVPLLGIGIGAGVNKVLTQRVGGRVREELGKRVALRETEPAEPTDVVDAQIVEE